MQEGKEGVIELKAVESHGEDEDFSCDDPEAVAYMLDFIYLGDYGHSDPIVAEARSSGPVLQPDSTYDHASGYMEDEPVDEFLGFNGFKKTRKKKRTDPCGQSPGQEPEQEPYVGAPTGIAQPKGSLTMHTRMYALAVKYDLKDLKNVAVAKMQMAVRGTWDREDFAKAIAVAFGAAPEGDTGMRDIIMATILSCSANLVSDPVVEKAINAVDGLPFELFKRQSTNSKRRGY